ncbi:multicopper oxidase domain-containing protein [Sphingomonas sp. RT2P30]
MFAIINRSILLCGVLAAATVLVAPGAAIAQAERDVGNPRLLPDTAGAPSKMLLSAVQGPGSAARERVLELDVVFTDSQIFNPATGRFDKVRLRSYNGTDVDPTTPYVSPTIEIRPGETIRVNLDNKLPPDPGCKPGDHMPDKPHCFNGTNLHTHGLWVNPAGNGDNVLLSINPGVQFQYEYNVPGDHPAGTFWYHTHRHGSTALQVSSGMAGALIIRGDRKPSRDRHGDIDTLLQGTPERVLVMQQIQYACMETVTQPDGAKVRQPKTNKDGTYRCDPGDVGTIDNYDLFGPGAWGKSGRFTSLNGVVLPTFHARQGQVERWRMIHAGVRDTIALQFARLRPNAKLLASLAPKAADRFLRQSCSADYLSYNLMAADGLTFAAAQQKKVAVFQPGYRFDALVVFPEPGIYCVIDAASPNAGSIGGEGTDVGPRLMGFVTVAPGTAVGPDVTAYLTNALVANADATMPPDVKPGVIADLRDGLKFTQFTPHPTITADEVTGTQELTFYIDVTNPNGTQFEVGITLNTADARSYDPNRIDRKLKLGGVDEWTLQSHFVSHPFHIHVNPFQVVEILDPNGKDVSAPGAIDDAGGTVDPEYAGLKGVWKDTLWIKSLVNTPGPPPPHSIYTIKVRTRYERYIGEYVLHCHILDHEDQGMMQNVAVVLPDGDVGDAQNQLQGHMQEHDHSH